MNVGMAWPDVTSEYLETFGQRRDVPERAVRHAPDRAQCLAYEAVDLTPKQISPLQSDARTPSAQRIGRRDDG